MEGTYDKIFGSNGSSFISGLDEYVDVEKDFDRVLSKLFIGVSVTLLIM